MAHKRQVTSGPNEIMLDVVVRDPLQSKLLQPYPIYLFFFTAIHLLYTDPDDTFFLTIIIVFSRHSYI